ncbi:unannotated protein [freshwater metagenome]|uniref:Unannotated protein n=1 Tax=freshwater metagenome TaxID=449393 RepID=A0A6J7FBD4_9ZZZZ
MAEAQVVAGLVGGDQPEEHGGELGAGGNAGERPRRLEKRMGVGRGRGIGIEGVEVGDTGAGTDATGG